jgi:hypothetical protein
MYIYLSQGLSGIKSPATGQKNRQFWNSNLEPFTEGKGRGMAGRE